MVTTIAGLLVSAVAVAQTASYDQLVAQGQADLQAGNAAQALKLSQQAIAAAPSRWEAYVIAGGALQVEQQYDSAADDFTKALQYAPEAKKAAIRGLLEKCFRAESEMRSAPVATPTTGMAASPTTTPPAAAATSGADVSPSFGETVQYIDQHISDAGSMGTRVNGPSTDQCSDFAIRQQICLPNPPDDVTVTDSMVYSIRIDGCNSLLVTRKGGDIHWTTYESDMNSRQWVPKRLDTLAGTQHVTIPILAVASVTGDDRSGLVVVHAGRSGVKSETDYPGSGPAKEVPYSPDGRPKQEQLNAAFNAGFNGQDLSDPSTYSEVPAGAALNIIWFSSPAFTSEAPHMASALQHLVDICKTHPEQAPKSLF